MTYMQLEYDDRTPVRKYRLKQVGSGSDTRILTIWQLLQDEGNGTINNLKTVGGLKSDLTIDGPVLLEEDAYAHEKTDADILQIVRIDNKW